MDGKVAVVTGATTGIGLETARGLAERGAAVVLVGRNPEKGAGAMASIRRTARHPERLRFVRADFADLEQVRAAALEIALAGPIDVLVNNAGVYNFGRKLTVQGLEETLAVNHLAPFLLTGLLLGAMAKDARIVTVASNAHEAGRIRLDDPMLSRGYGGFRAYAQSKLANILFTFELARRLERSGRTANCLHPGAVASGFGLNNGPLIRTVFSVLTKTPLYISPQRGAETSVYLASSPEVAGASGKYFYLCREARTAKRALDAETGRALWAMSEELTGFKYRV